VQPLSTTTLHQQFEQQQFMVDSFRCFGLSLSLGLLSQLQQRTQDAVGVDGATTGLASMPTCFMSLDRRAVAMALGSQAKTSSRTIPLLQLVSHLLLPFHSSKGF